MVGFGVGGAINTEGLVVGTEEGVNVDAVGAVDGTSDGDRDGCFVGLFVEVGYPVGTVVGSTVG